MDDDVTLEEMATCLGLIDGTYEHRIREDLELTRLPGVVVPEGVLVEAFDERIKMQRIVSALGSDALDDGRLLAEFAHRYLPDLLKAHAIASANAWKNPWASVLVGLGGMVNPYFDRYARDPVKGKALLESFTLLYTMRFPSAADLLDQTPHPHKMMTRGYEAFYTTRSILGFLAVFAVSQSSGVRPPRPNTSPASLLLLQRLSKLNSELKTAKSNLRGRSREDIDEILSYAAQLAGLLVGSCPSSMLQMLVESSPWWRCEAKGAEMGAGPCGRVKAGDEMMACGRCKTVRYCSVAHQKLHWKIYKKTCWEPIW